MVRYVPKSDLKGTIPVKVYGDFFPREFRGRFHVVFAILRSFYAALRLVLLDQYDIIFVDQVENYLTIKISTAIPLLRFNGAKIMFYCHFPDKLLTTRTTLMKKLYRLPGFF